MAPALRDASQKCVLGVVGLERSSLRPAPSALITRFWLSVDATPG
ncbi:hypothetical protein [Intestinirhabdus alba]|nr:hypothetical protein [Intestinirhabdus alba]